MPAISSDSASDAPTLSNPAYLVGLIVALVLLLGVTVWLGLRSYRKRLSAKRKEKTDAAFLSVKGLVMEDPFRAEKGFVQRAMLQPTANDRDDMEVPSITFPDRALDPHSISSTREEILNYHRRTGSIPTAFSSSNPAPSINPAFSHSQLSLDSPSNIRKSWVSMRSNRFSVMSTTSSFSSMSSGTTRKVRQMFDPVLPDEILVRLGEQLTLVQSFDDGWCVVGRENASLIQSAKSLFNKYAPTPETNVELGVVPAWCFIKPVKGLRAERPMRTSSLGVVVNIEAAGPNRDQIISWSNF